MMEVVHKDKGTDLISVLPDPPKYFNGPSKEHFKRVGKILIGAQILKTIHLDALGILAQNLAQLQFALESINKANRRKAGSGYIQKFKSGAANISPEVTLKEKAEAQIFKCLKQFGLDPKSEKDLNLSPSGQYSLFEEIFNKLAQ